MRRLFVLSIAVLSLYVTSCDDRSVFNRFVPIEKEGWHKDTAVSFTFEVLDIENPYDLYFCLRNNSEYAFSNLYLFCEIHPPTSQVTKGDTLQYMLSDGKGNWLGRGSTDMKENLFYYKKGFVFHKKGKYTISVKHGMRAVVLPGIMDVGLRITPLLADE